MSAAAASTDSATPRSVLTLVLGVLGVCGLPILGPVAWIVGEHELNDIRAGRVPRAGEGISRAGVVLGMLATAWLVLTVVLPFLVGVGIPLLAVGLGIAVLGVVLAVLLALFLSPFLLVAWVFS